MGTVSNLPNKNFGMEIRGETKNGGKEPKFA